MHLRTNKMFVIWSDQWNLNWTTFTDAKIPKRLFIYFFSPSWSMLIRINCSFSVLLFILWRQVGKVPIAFIDRLVNSNYVFASSKYSRKRDEQLMFAMNLLQTAHNFDNCPTFSWPSTWLLHVFWRTHSHRNQL